MPTTVFIYLCLYPFSYKKANTIDVGINANLKNLIYITSIEITLEVNKNAVDIKTIIICNTKNAFIDEEY